MSLRHAVFLLALFAVGIVLGNAWRGSLDAPPVSIRSVQPTPVGLLVPPVALPNPPRFRAAAPALHPPADTETQPRSLEDVQTSIDHTQWALDDLEEKSIQAALVRAGTAARREEYLEARDETDQDALEATRAALLRGASEDQARADAEAIYEQGMLRQQQILRGAEAAP